MGVFKEIPKSDGTTTLFYRLDGDRNTVEAGSTYGLGTIDYEGALNKPSINGVTLVGDKTAEELGLQRAGAIPDGIVLEENLGSGFEIDDDGIITVAGDFENILEVKSGEEIMNAPANYNGTVICSSSYGSAERGNIYVLEGGRIVETLISVSESGGIVINTNNSETISPLELNVALGTEVKLKFNYKSLTNGKGVAKLYMNNALRATKSITIGENEFDITDYVKSGINVFTVEVTDSNNFTVMIDYLVNGVNLTLKSNFNANLVYANKVEYRYVVVGAGLKTVHFLIDGEEIGTQEVKMTGEEAIYSITNLKHGAQKLEIYATTVIDDITITSNTLTYKLLFAVDGNMTPIVSSTFDRTECIEGELLNIDYIIYNPAETITDGYLQINDNEPIAIKADRSLHYWGVNNYPLGEVVFKIGCGEQVYEIPMTVNALEIDLEPVTDGLQLYLTAANRANTETEENRQIWQYEDITTSFTNLNWVSNGWIDGSLKLTGAAHAVINFNLFEEDLKVTGKTIDFEFETHNVSNLESVLISCWAEGKGIKITSTECIVASEQETIRTRFKENERTRITITIENLNSHRMIKTYVDGVLSGIAQYTDQDNFQHINPVGITLNEGGEEIDIRSIKVYNTALSNRAVLTNYIYDIQDITEKITKYNINDIYDQEGGVHWGKVKSRIPIMYITGDLPTSKGAPTNVVIEYQNPFTPTDNFKYENCELDIQGTSSVYYPRKNYQIVFPERFCFYNGAVPEFEYTMKADYMESSHSHNTGNAIFVNTLYEEYFPTQAENNGVRNTIYGFPCVIYLRDNENAEYEYIGVYNFNNDKNSPATLGLTTDKAESWEFKNNTSAHCLLRSDDFSVAAKPEDDFVARYPVGHTDYTALKRVVSWIVSTENNLDKFRDEFNQYFNLHYCLIYYVMMDFGLLMDSRAKNMFFDTVDGLIWYPRFYDIDTAYGLNNEGVLDFGYGLEQTDENIYNGRNSLFWNNFQEVFAKDITDMYLSLRMSEKLSYDAALAVFEQHQRSQISEANYNEDAAWKYLAPLYETGDTTYLYVVQGSRIQHFKWWIANRIKYLDSKYEAPDFTKDFITMRLYTKDGDFKLIPYIDTYIKCRFGSADVKVRAKAGEEIELNAPEGLEFNDTETIIFGGSNISSLGDLSSKYAGTVDIKAGAKLRELILGNTSPDYTNPHLKILSLGSNDLLTKLDVSNCPNLTGSLDVSGCKKLQEVWAEGTGITGLNFVDGGDLTTLHLPPTITNLTIKNHINLLEVSPTSFDNLQTLVLKNTRLNATNLFYDNFPSLTRLYCKFDEASNTSINKTVMDVLLEQCGGIDDNGLNTPLPNLQGYLSLSYPSSMTANDIEQMKQDYASYFPDLNITYTTESVYYSYNSSNNRVQNNTNVTYPAVIAIPGSKYIERSLGLADGTIKDTTDFYFYHSGTSSYKSNAQRLVIPGGYRYYDITIDYFPKLGHIIWPVEEVKIRSFKIDITDFYGNGQKAFDVLDLSAPSINLEELSSIQVRANTARKIIINNKTINRTGTLFNEFIYWMNDSGTILKDVYLTNLTLPNITSFGSWTRESTGRQVFASGGTVDFSGLNAPKMTTFGNILMYASNSGYGLYTFRMNDCFLPELTTMSLRAYTSYRTVKYIELKNLFIPKMTNMGYMFYYQTQLEKIEWSNIQAPAVTDLNNMFSYCMALKEIDVSVLDTSNVVNMTHMFYNCDALTELDLSTFNTSKVTNMSSMLNDCALLSKVNTTGWNFDSMLNLTALCAHSPKLAEINLNYPVPLLETANDLFRECKAMTNINLSNWSDNKLQTLERMFDTCILLEYLDISNLKTNNVTNMAYMFNECNSLTELNLLSFTTSKVTDMSYMFYNCNNLIEIDLSSFTGEQLLTTNRMFYNCVSLKNINLSNLNTPVLTNTQYMFYGCSSLNTLKLDNFNTSAVTDMSYMFRNCSALSEGNINNIANNVLDYSSAVDISYMFAGTNITTFDVTKLALNKITGVTGLFSGCSKLEEIDINTILSQPQITNVSYLLANCSSLRQLDLANVNLSHITTSTGFLEGCTGIEEIILDNTIAPGLGQGLFSVLPGKSFESFDTSTSSLGALNFSTNSTYNYITIGDSVNVDYVDLTGYTSMTIGTMLGYCYFFENSHIKHLKLPPLKLTFSNTNYSALNLNTLFGNLKGIEELTVNTVENPRNTTMANAFSGMSDLRKIHGLEHLPTYTAASMSAMFSNCSALEEIDISSFTFTSCTTIANMFQNCSSLKTVNMEGIDCQLVTTMQYMFDGCSSLTNINMSGAKYPKVTNVSYMFRNSGLVDIDLSAFNPTAATTTTYMFYGCKKLKRLNLSGFTFAKNQSFTYMFYDCSSLEYLDIRNWDISKITTNANANYMFNYVPYDCTIVVKNETCRTWLKGKRSDFVNIKLPSEL